VKLNSVGLPDTVSTSFYVFLGLRYDEYDTPVSILLNSFSKAKAKKHI